MWSDADDLRLWQPPITGEVIMQTFGIPPSKEVGVIKTAVREAILDGEIPNKFKAAFNRMVEEGKKIGLVARKGVGARADASKCVQNTCFPTHQVSF